MRSLLAVGVVVAALAAGCSGGGGPALDEQGYPVSSHSDGVQALQDAGMGAHQAECVQDYLELQISYQDWVALRKTADYQSWLSRNGSDAQLSCG